jgi:hypothetical protein
MLSRKIIFFVQNYRKCKKEQKALKHMIIDTNVYSIVLMSISIE